MLFMNICTWTVENQRKVEEKWRKWKWPAGVTVICEFTDLQGGRSFNVIKTDMKGLIATRADWMDLVKFETFPVYPIGVSKPLAKEYYG
ncbi:MAG: DUF3303 domain-containing protein [Thermodesulfobacteriota bacterium]